MEEENTPVSDVLKQKSNPKLSNIKKLGAIVIPHPNPPEPEDVNFLKADTFNDGLQVLKIDVPVTIKSITGAIQSIDYPIRNAKDLTQKGMKSNIPVMQELKSKEELLHNLHSNLTNFRVKNAVNHLFQPNENGDTPQKNLFVQLLSNAADSLKNH